MNVGVICFDEYRYLSEGWASINGNPAQRVTGVNELDTGTLWITNLYYNSYRQHNLTQSPNIFDHQYFRSSIKLISEEMGVSNDPKATAEFCSEVFTRVLSKSIEIFQLDISHFGYRFANLLADNIMPSFARQSPAGVNGARLIDIFKQANQANQAMMGNRPFGSAHINLTIPRTTYMKWLLSQPLPDSNTWEEKNFKSGKEKVIGVRAGKEIKGTSASLKKLQESHDEGVAAFYKVKILSSDPHRKLFQSFGNGSSYIRQWVSLPELCYLSQYNEIEVSESVSSTLSPLSLSSLLANDNSDYSYSMGLLWENVLAALCTTVGQTRSETALSAYIRSYDRIACGSIAKSLFDEGFTVGSYGMGKVITYCKKNEQSRLVEVCEKLNLIPPLNI